MNIHMYVPIHIVDAIFIYAYAYTSDVFIKYITLWWFVVFHKKLRTSTTFQITLHPFEQKLAQTQDFICKLESSLSNFGRECLLSQASLKCFGCWHWYCESWFASSCVKQFCAFRAVALDVLWQHAQVFPALSKLNALKFLQLAMWRSCFLSFSATGKNWQRWLQHGSRYWHRTRHCHEFQIRGWVKLHIKRDVWGDEHGWRWMNIHFASLLFTKVPGSWQNASSMYIYTHIYICQFFFKCGLFSGQWVVLRFLLDLSMCPWLCCDLVLSYTDVYTDVYIYIFYI